MQIHEGIKDNEDGIIQPSQLIKSVPPGSPQNTFAASGMKIRGRSVLAHRPTKHRTQRELGAKGPQAALPLPSYPTPHWNSSEVYLTRNRKPAIT